MANFSNKPLAFLKFSWLYSFRTRQNYTPIGFMLLGKIGHKIYNNGFEFICWVFCSLAFGLIFFAFSKMLTSQVISANRSGSFLVFGFVLILFFSEGLMRGTQLLGNYALFNKFPISLHEKTLIYFFHEFFGFKLFLFIYFLVLDVLYSLNDERQGGMVGKFVLYSLFFTAYNILTNIPKGYWKTNPYVGVFFLVIVLEYGVVRLAMSPNNEYLIGFLTKMESMFLTDGGWPRIVTVLLFVLLVCLFYLLCQNKFKPGTRK